MAEHSSIRSRRVSQSAQKKYELSKQYANTVQRYSQLTQEDSLYCGLHYRQLARFLRSPSPSVVDIGGRESRSSSRTRGGNRHSNNGSFAFVTIHDFKADDSDDGCGHKTITFFDASNPLAFAQAASTQRSSSDLNTGQIVFLRGYPSAEWLNLLGATFEIDPEFFRRHMCFPPYGFLDLPALPTSSRHIMLLKITTIVALQEPLSIGTIQQYRKDEMKWIRKQHQGYLASGSTVGRSIIRREYPLHQTRVVIEQNVSCCIERKGGGWTAIIWLDQGRNLFDNPSYLWPAGNTNPSSRHGDCFPTIFQHFPKIALNLGESENNTLPVPSSAAHKSANTNNNLIHSIDLLHSQYGHTLDQSLVSADSVYGLSELFNFASSSENQFLNAVQQQISEEAVQFGDQMEFSLYNLRYYKERLEDHIQYICEVLSFIKSQSTPIRVKDKGTTTTATTPPISSYIDNNAERTAHQQATINAVVAGLLVDFEHLLHRAQVLSTRCTHASNTIVSAASLEESRKAILKAEIMERLTVLAFLFLPSSFTTSFLGMNIKQYGSGISIWIAFIALFVFTSFSLIILFWNKFKDIIIRLIPFYIPQPHKDTRAEQPFELNGL